MTKEDELDESQNEEALSLIKKLEEDIMKFQNYRIPTNFFGLGVGINYGNIIENHDDV